jgi:hypothetical protein
VYQRFFVIIRTVIIYQKAFRVFRAITASASLRPSIINAHELTESGIGAYPFK